MTRKSKRELERKIGSLESRAEPNTDATLLIAPDGSFRGEDLPDVDTTGIRVHDPDTDRRVVEIPYHCPEVWWQNRLPVVAESHVAAVWRNMNQEQLIRECRLRHQNDDPFPPILEELVA